MDREGKGRLFEFFAEENQKFKSYVRRKIRSISEMDAEDIVEEVMMNMFARSDGWAHVENLTAYIYRSLHNRIVDYSRQSFRTVSLQSFLDEDGELPFIDLLADNTANVYSEAERREFMRRLAKAVSSLDPKQGAVFVATEMKGRTFRELSEEWGEPIGTLLSRKCRAVKALQNMLEDFKV